MNTCTCGKLVLIADALRINIKATDHVIFSYDMLCPQCKRYLGRMFWGEFHWDKALLDASAETNRQNGDRRADERRRDDRRQGDRRVGLPMGPVVRYILLEQGIGDRRRQERRQTERRQGERRQSERRLPDGRQSAGAQRESEAGMHVTDPSERRAPNDRRNENVPVMFDRRLLGADRRKKGRDVSKETIKLSI